VQPPPAHRPMTWDDARALEPLGIDFAPHSISHRIFSRLSDAEARAEITESWLRLKQELRNPLPLFAWPTGRVGDYTERDVALLPAVGLNVCASAVAGYAEISHEVQPLHGVHNFTRFPFPDRIRDVLQYGSWIERGKELVRGALGGRP